MQPSQLTRSFPCTPDEVLIPARLANLLELTPPGYNVVRVELTLSTVELMKEEDPTLVFPPVHPVVHTGPFTLEGYGELVFMYRHVSSVDNLIVYAPLISKRLFGIREFRVTLIGDENRLIFPEGAHSTFLGDLVSVAEQQYVEVLVEPVPERKATIHAADAAAWAMDRGIRPAAIGLTPLGADLK